MNLDTALDSIQNFRAQLDSWGMTTQVLLLIGFAAIVLLMFSVREIFGWFLRVHTLRREIQVLNEKIDHLTALVAKQQTPVIAETAVPLEKISKENSQFRLDH